MDFLLVSGVCFNLCAKTKHLAFSLPVPFHFPIHLSDKTGAGPRPVKKTERWGAGIVICLERDADLHMAQLMPLPLTVSCFGKIQIGFTFLVPAHPGSPEQRVVKWVCVCVWQNSHAGV